MCEASGLETRKYARARCICQILLSHVFHVWVNLFASERDVYRSSPYYVVL